MIWQKLHQGSLITIAIPTLAGGQILESCLEALSAQVFRNFEVIIINNGQSPAIDPRILLSYPHRVISPGSNVGFGMAVNLAIRASSSPYIATLNDDTEPHPEWLLALVREMEQDPIVGMCASRIQMHGSPALDSAGMMICFDGSSKQRGHSQPAASFDRSQEVLFPSGCAALYRRRMLDEVGLFDEDYFLYCEDTDLGLRARWAGWECRYVPGALVAHRYSSTAGAFSLMKARFVERNRLWVALKNFPCILLFFVPFVSLSRYFWQLRSARGARGAAGGFIRSGNSVSSAVLVLLGAHGETLWQLRSLLRKRAQARKTRRLSSLEFARLMYRHRISAKDLARA